VLHHALGRCGNGGREAQNTDRSDPDRRAYHRLALPRSLPSLNGRCSDDKRPNALSPTAIGVTTSHITFSRLLEPFTGAWTVWDHDPRPTISGAQAEGRCAVFDRALCAGVCRRPAFITLPRPWPENCLNRVVCDDICGGCCEPQKHPRVGEEWAGTDILRTDGFASAQFDAHARRSSYTLPHCNHGLRGK
jgi:hypothetical protein